MADLSTASCPTLRDTAEGGTTAPWRAIAGLSARLARETTVEGLSNAYIREVQALLPAAGYGLYLFDPSTQVVDLRITRRVSEYVLAVYERRGRAADPLMRHLLTHKRATSSAALGTSQWQSSPMYDICQLQRFDHKIEAPILTQGRFVGSLHFAFAHEHGSPTSNTVELGEALGLLMGGLLDAAAKRDDLHRACHGLQAGLELAREALVITDLRDGERRANGVARRLLRRLREADPRFRLDSTLTDALGDGLEGTATMEVSLPDGPGVLLVRSIRDKEDPDLVATVLELEQRDDTELPPDLEALLTPREVEVARLVATGSGNGEIAAQLHLSPYTVKEYVSRVYRKTGVASRMELARLAARRNRSLN